MPSRTDVNDSQRRAEAYESLLTVLRPVPKVDLHVHLTGCLRPATVAELSGLRNVEGALRLPPRLGSYRDFFAPWDGVLAAVPDTPSAIYRMLIEASEDLAADNVRYAEMRVSARRAQEAGALNDWLDAIADAVQFAQVKHGFGIGIVLGFARQRFTSAQSAIRSAYAVLDRATGRKEVVGFDVWGDESVTPSDQYFAWLSDVRDSGYGVTMHLGEVGDTRRIVANALMRTRPDRVSHGPAIANSPRLLSILEHRQVLTEVCLTSNEVTRSTVERRFARYSLRRLAVSDAPIGICTDDPAIFGTTLSSEMARGLVAGIFSPRRIIASLESSIKHSFASADIKTRLQEELKPHVATASRGMQQVVERFVRAG